MKLHSDQNPALVGGLRLSKATESLARVVQHVAADEYSKLLEDAASPIFGVDANGIIDVWNASASKVSGYESKEITGKPLADFVKQDSRFLVENMIREVRERVGPDLFRGIVPLKTKNENNVELLLVQLTSKQISGVGRFIGLM